MNSKPDALAVLPLLAQRVAEPQWQANGTLLCGRLGRVRCRGRALAHGATVALQLARPWQQAAEVCLLLAAAPAAADDAVYLADGSLWLLRRYPATLREVEFDLLFKQQQTVRALLNWPSRRPPVSDSHPVGRFA